MTPDAEALARQGWAALEACRWSVARTRFEQALAVTETAGLVDGLGQALYWQGQYREAVALRERAYALYREQGDRPAAAFVAMQLAQLHGLIYGNAAAVSGWLSHAQRMLEDCEECPSHGWVELFLGCIAADPLERERRASAAVAVGRRFGAPGLEFDALGYVGKARVERGAVIEGMQLIDEAVAAASSRLVTEPWAAGEIYCTLFHACEMALDIRRAEQWLGTVDSYVDHTGELPIAAICRMHYGGLLAAVGRWADAERELQSALAIYDDTYRGSRYEPLMRLADLRVRQGRLEEAERLLDGHYDRSEAALPQARLLQALGQPVPASRVLDRYLAGRGCEVPLAPCLTLGVEIDVARGALEAARWRAEDLEKLAVVTGQPAFHGLASLSRARIAVAAKEDGAVEKFETALAAFLEAEVTYEVGVVRLELAVQLAEVDPAVARSEARRALDSFQRLGAAREADAAAGLLRQLGDRGRPWPRGHGTLTKRQTQVLELLAEGLTNAAIAERLVISTRTAEHHVSNILAALNLRSRAEAAAFAHRRSAAEASSRQRTS